MEDNNLKNSFLHLLIKIYGKEIVKFYIPNALEITTSETEIKKFYKEYIRFKQITQTNNDEKINLELKGCGKCISENLMVLEQDFPGWLGKLKNIHYIIIGQEVADSVRFQSHIAYDYYPNSSLLEENKIMVFSEKLEQIIPEIKSCAYITDVAKCFSNNQSLCRDNCIDYLKEEISLICSMDPNNRKVIIVQGISTLWNVLKKNFDIEEIEEPFRVDGQRLLILGYIYINSNIKVPTVVVPHSTSQNNYQWSLIKKNIKIMQNKIDNFLLKHQIKRNNQ